MTKTSLRATREAKQLFRLCLVNGAMDEGRVRQVVERVIGGKRRGYLLLLARFLRLVKLDNARRTAEVDSAAPLPPDLRATVQADLEALYGPEINVLFEDHPELIGGMRVRVGSDVYDGSVKRELTALESRF